MGQPPTQSKPSVLSCVAPGADVALKGLPTSTVSVASRPWRCNRAVCQRPSSSRDSDQSSCLWAPRSKETRRRPWDSASARWSPRPPVQSRSPWGSLLRKRTSTSFSGEPLRRVKVELFNHACLHIDRDNTPKFGNKLSICTVLKYSYAENGGGIRTKLWIKLVLMSNLSA